MHLILFSAYSRAEKFHGRKNSPKLAGCIPLYYRYYVNFHFAKAIKVTITSSMQSFTQEKIMDKIFTNENR